jgi:hypothetical protein
MSIQNETYYENDPELVSIIAPKFIRNDLQSLSICLTDQEITFEQNRHRFQIIPCNEIGQINVYSDKQIVILGKGKKKIIIGKYLKDRESFLKELEKRSIAPTYIPSSILDKMILPLNLFIAASILFVFVSANLYKDKNLSIISICILECVIIFGFSLLLYMRKRMTSQAFNFTAAFYLFIIIIFGSVLLSAI